MNIILPRELVERVIDLFYAVQPRYEDAESEEQAWEEIYRYRRELKSALSQPSQVPLTDREVELVDGMIEVQLSHAERCDHIANRRIAAKQKEWDMERVALLRKLKAAHGIGVTNG